MQHRKIKPSLFIRFSTIRIVSTIVLPYNKFITNLNAPHMAYNIFSKLPYLPLLKHELKMVTRIALFVQTKQIKTKASWKIISKYPNTITANF